MYNKLVKRNVGRSVKTTLPRSDTLCTYVDCTWCYEVCVVPNLSVICMQISRTHSIQIHLHMFHGSYHWYCLRQCCTLFEPSESVNLWCVCEAKATVWLFMPIYWSIKPLYVTLYRQYSGNSWKPKEVTVHLNSTCCSHNNSLIFLFLRYGHIVHGQLSRIRNYFCVFRPYLESHTVEHYSKCSASHSILKNPSFKRLCTQVGLLYSPIHFACPVHQLTRSKTMGRSLVNANLYTFVLKQGPKNCNIVATLLIM